VTDKEIDNALEGSARTPHDLDDTVLEPVYESIKTSLRPVLALPSTWVLTCGLLLTCSAIALAGAARAGFYGIEKMDPLQRVLIFSSLCVVAGFAGTGLVHEMIPGSRHRLSTGALLTACSVALVGVFALMFRDYRTEHFVSAGILCLITGVFHAIPAALLSWWVLRRGFAVNPVSAGLVAGTLAGLAGVGVLELHCANFQATHVLVWHTAVVPLSGGAGGLASWALSLRRRRSETSAAPRQ
jgi:hypothetical protein